MSYYDEDFYMEPSEFEEEIETLKESISKSIQKKFLDEMKALRAENETLWEFRDNKEKYERELKAAKAEYKYKMQQAESQANKKKLKDLLSTFAVTGYRPEPKYKQGPKCDRCDENRRFHFVSPMGRKMTEECSCAKSIRSYSPKEVRLIEFYAKKELGSTYFERVREDEECDRYSLCAQIYEKDMEPFEDVNWYYAVFLDKDNCQKYCDWLNEREALEDG